MDFDIIDCIADVFEGIADFGSRKGESIWPKLLLIALLISIVIFIICSIV